MIPFPRVTRHIDRVFIHCSASDNKNHDDINVIEDWHLDRGFDGVGYSFFIKKDGTIQNGRELDRTPAAQKDHNKGTIAICLHGLEHFTETQFDSLIVLCYSIAETYSVSFHGHCEVSSKTCPVFPYKKVLGLDEHGKLTKEKLPWMT